MALCRVIGTFANLDGTPYRGKVQVIPDSLSGSEQVVFVGEPLTFHMSKTNGAFSHSFAVGTYTVVVESTTYQMVVPENTQVELSKILTEL